jgi:hypothetical protein
MMDERPEWFAAKRYGYGAGLPIAWQGWAVLTLFMIVVAGAGLLLNDKPLLAATIVFPSIAGLLVVTAKTTRGGWRWRWGEKD